MIYTVISSLKENRIDKDKRDCRIIRQPLSLLQGELSEYVESAKNETVRAERCLAYTTLLCALKSFYNLENVRIVRNEYGKPYIADCGLYFNISHSDGSIAVCISDEGEVGVDIQSEIDPERAKRLEGRFFTDLSVKSEDVDIKYYFFDITSDEAKFSKITLSTATECFTAKWSYAESLMKLYGTGFGDVGNISELSNNARSTVKNVNLNHNYFLSVSIKK
jgi:phosphopantetheinyl transferase